jgi:CRP/FNR family transcriptional regulator
MDLLENSIEKTKKLKKKEFLFKNGDKLRGIYAIKSGAIKTSISNNDGNEQILAFHLPGDIVGFDAFNTSVHHVNAEALDDALICELPIEQFEKLCDKLPVIREEIMHQVGDVIEHGHRMLLTLGQMQTEERLASFLLSLSDRNKERHFSQTEFQLSMSRRDIANYLGMAVETLSRLFSKFQDKGLIAVSHKNITILDEETLRTIAHKTNK